MVILYILLALAAVVLLIAYLCFRMAFYVPKKILIGPDDYPIPEGDIYEPHREQMTAWMKEVRALPCTEHHITSHDGLQLWGKYYECLPGAPMEIMFHGYRGCAERDLCGGVQRAFSVGHNVLIVDQRTAGKSDGKVISFGVNESKDCLRWLDYAIQTFGKSQKIILTGISMGASTVLLASANQLPEQVIGVLADCGYTSAEAIIKRTIRKMRLPADLLYPFVKLAAKLFGHFDLEEYSPIEAVKNCRLPVIFFHGEGDDFVPCYMSQENYDACASRKALFTVPGAGHGLSFPAMQEWYIRKLGEFFGPEASAK